MDAVLDIFTGLFGAVAKLILVVVTVVLVFALTALGAAIAALVVRDYWNWFVAPLGLPQIGLAHALGLTMFVALLRTDYSKRPTDADNFERELKATVSGFLGLALTWCAGWLIFTLGGPF